MPEKRTKDYVRHDTTSLFAAFDTSDGSVITSLRRRHHTIEFRKFLTNLPRSTTPVVLDQPLNLQTVDDQDREMF